MKDQEARVDLENSDESAPPPPHEPQQQGMGATNTEAEIAATRRGASQRDLQQPRQRDITQDGAKGDQLDDITTKSFSVTQELHLPQEHKESIQNQPPNLTSTQQDKAPQQAQMNEDKAKQPLPIKELMKQAFKNNNDFSENNNSVDIWNFKDNYNRQLGTDEQGRKIIQRKTATAPYIVEITEADEIMEESKPAQAMEGHWEVELAQNISNSLRIKRKRTEVAQLCMAGNESGATTLAEETGLNKRIREDFATDMVEEAGLTTPQTPP
ncbi:hypothetical protein PIB30_075181 [Stylosanthes scabra]|uniref:Uncharacterized protein n=1 Tax=Stylosanthes scabra TaxID=79078 RepID=A0ABU6SR88_9FABA|nr:hypothetical protein [Stylosanthes scabra]